jgi:hypothetical protein
MFATISLMIVVPAVFLLQECRPHPEAYCVKERARRKMTSAHTVVFRNGKKALKGKCSSCGAMLFRIK